MSAMADATQLAIERALDHAGVRDAVLREMFAERFYIGNTSIFERAAVQAEFAKITRADIGRKPLEDVREIVLTKTAERILESWQSSDNPEPII